MVFSSFFGTNNNENEKKWKCQKCFVISFPIVLIITIVSVFSYYIYYKFFWHPGVNEYRTITPTVWKEYEEKYKANTSIAPFLNDFSYAGYKLQNQELPTITLNKKKDVGTVTFSTGNSLQYKVYNIKKAGCDDTGKDSCGACVQKIIDSISEGGIVYFPEGRYKFGGKGIKDDLINIKKSNIFLIGDGTDKSTLYLEHLQRNNKHLIHVNGGSGRTNAEVNVISNIQRLTNILTVNQKGEFHNGDCFRLTGVSTQITKDWFGDIIYPEKQWTGISHYGASIFQMHCITNIVEQKHSNKSSHYLFHLDSPLHESIKVSGGVSLVLNKMRLLKNIAIENLRLESGWKTDSDPFCHLCDNKRNSGYQAIQIQNTHDSWIRNCVFDSWIQGVTLTQSRAVTVSNTKIIGKEGHHGYQSLRGTGNLFIDNVDEVSYHGPSVENADTGTVFLRTAMGKGQHIDAHGQFPIATLFDQTIGGIFFHSGGATDKLPHHASRLTVWNFHHRIGNAIKNGKTKQYNFWPTHIPTYHKSDGQYFKPIFIGIYGNGDDNRYYMFNENSIFYSEGIQQNTKPDPSSLFDSQLKIRKEHNNRLPNYFVPKDLVSDYVKEKTKSQHFKYYIKTNYHPQVKVYWSTWYTVLYYSLVSLTVLLFFFVFLGLLRCYCNYKNNKPTDEHMDPDDDRNQDWMALNEIED